MAHYFGDAPFADRHTPRDSFLTAILTLGEGTHAASHVALRSTLLRTWLYDPRGFTIHVALRSTWLYDLILARVTSSPRRRAWRLWTAANYLSRLRQRGHRKLTVRPGRSCALYQTATNCSRLRRRVSVNSLCVLDGRARAVKTQTSAGSCTSTSLRLDREGWNSSMQDHRVVRLPRASRAPVTRKLRFIC